MNENSIVIKYLKKLGYNPITDYYNNISYWKEWYDNNVSKFHKFYDDTGNQQEMYKLGMAKKGCEDWSSILYAERDTMTCDKKDNQEYLNKQLKKLKFEDVIPENIEKSFWSGTLGTIIRLKNVILKDSKLYADEKTTEQLINVTADKIIPLRIENGEIIDVAFVSKSIIGEESVYYIEIHELKEDGYEVKNLFINEKGEPRKKDNILDQYKTYSNIPLFSLLSPRIVNNIENNNGLGISIFANAIDQLKGIDIAYNNAIMDVYLGGKKVFYNKSLIKYQKETITDGNGNSVTREIPIYPDDLTRQQFKILDGDLSNVNDDTLIHEYNPELRADEDEKEINLNLNLYSFKLGLGKGFYKFENQTVVTATQYLGENKDLVDNAKKHRQALNEYTVGIARAVLLLGRILFNEQVDENDNIQLTNRDGFLVSDEELQQQYREDFRAGLMSKVTYLMKARGMSEEQAIQELKKVKQYNSNVDDLIGTSNEE